MLSVDRAKSGRNASEAIEPRNTGSEADKVEYLEGNSRFSIMARKLETPTGSESMA
jgi:hypothetical protein